MFSLLLTRTYPSKTLKGLVFIFAALLIGRVQGAAMKEMLL